MKNQLVLLLGVTMLAVACKKDLQSEEQFASQNTTPVATAASTQSAWTTVSGWQSKSGKQTTTYEAKIDAPAISSGVVANGMVLIYANNGSSIEALPYDQADGTSWYYQVSEGAIEVSAESKSSSKNLSGTSLRYFVISAEKLASLEGQGYSKSDLMQLSYSKAESLLNQ